MPTVYAQHFILRLPLRATHFSPCTAHLRTTRQLPRSACYRAFTGSIYSSWRCRSYSVALHAYVQDYRDAWFYQLVVAGIPTTATCIYLQFFNVTCYLHYLHFTRVPHLHLPPHTHIVHTFYLRLAHLTACHCPHTLPTHLQAYLSVHASTFYTGSGYRALLRYTLPTFFYILSCTILLVPSSQHCLWCAARTTRSRVRTGVARLHTLVVFIRLPPPRALPGRTYRCLPAAVARVGVLRDITTHTYPLPLGALPGLYPGCSTPDQRPGSPTITYCSYISLSRAVRWCLGSPVRSHTFYINVPSVRMPLRHATPGTYTAVYARTPYHMPFNRKFPAHTAHLPSSRYPCALPYLPCQPTFCAAMNTLHPTFRTHFATHAHILPAGSSAHLGSYFTGLVAVPGSCWVWFPCTPAPTLPFFTFTFGHG